MDIPSFTSNPAFLGFVFIVFVLSIKKMKKIVFNSMWIAFAAVIFPIAMSRIFGLSVPTDANSLVFYLTVGVGAYFVYLFARSVYTVLGAAEKAASPFSRKLKGGGAAKREKKMDRIIEEKEKEEKLKAIERKSRKKPEDEYVVLQEKKEPSGNKNIIRKFREAED